MKITQNNAAGLVFLLFVFYGELNAAEFQKPYTSPCVERENVFSFTEKPTIKYLGNDKYEISFAVKGYCDVTVGIIDSAGKVVRHLGAGVLGSNAPEPFQKNTKKQTLYWDGKDDLGEYVKVPEKLRLQVRLGLKPEFDKILGTNSNKALAGYICGIAADESGMYVFSKTLRGRYGNIHRYDSDAKYVETVFPPPGNLSKEKMKGMVGIEYEKGKFGIYGPDVGINSFQWGQFMPAGVWGNKVTTCQPAIIGDRIYFFGTSPHVGRKLFWILKNGETELAGLQGRLLPGPELKFVNVFLVPSLDKKSLLISGMPGPKDKRLKDSSGSAVFKFNLDKKDGFGVFAGNPAKMGIANGMFSSTSSMSRDAQGRIYAADALNRRIQIFSPSGKHLKNIKIENPDIVQVHQKTGAIYVSQHLKVKGRRANPKTTLLKFKPYPDLSQEKKWETGFFNGMVLDSWSEKPRLWTSYYSISRMHGGSIKVPYSIRILEDDNGKIKTFLDFDQETAKESVGGAQVPVVTGGGQHVNCDSLREQIYVYRKYRFDLKSGKYLGKTPGFGGNDSHTFSARATKCNDLAFDKRGFMHLEVSDGLDAPLASGLCRLDPMRTETFQRGTKESQQLVEVPYDYGATEENLNGLVKIHKTSHHRYSWGFGVNMKGDMAVTRHVEYLTKLGDEDVKQWASAALSRALGNGGPTGAIYARFKIDFENRKKRGEEFLIPRVSPGLDYRGAQIFTFDQHGEILHEAGVAAGSYTLGLQIDEDRKLYFGHQNVANVDGRQFLLNKGRIFGTDKWFTPTTGVWVKSDPNGVEFLYEDARVKMDPMPTRTPEMHRVGIGSIKPKVWSKGVDWIYAGYSPFPIDDCHCPQVRAHLDWYKRSFVPEGYRRSIGVLDSNGNLILHFGRYGNRDSGNGPNSKIKVGGDEITSTFVRFVSGTDNYVVFNDFGSKVVVLKLNYHAEETVGISIN